MNTNNSSGLTLRILCLRPGLKYKYKQQKTNFLASVSLNNASFTSYPYFDKS